MIVADLDERVPRHPLGVFPTPLLPAERLGHIVGMDRLWVKRDDLSGFSWGGNKVRPAEYLIGDALSNGVGELVIAGGPTSNFAAIMAAAGRSVGLRVHQVSYGTEPRHKSSALLSGRLSGASVSFTGSSNRALMEEMGERLAADRPAFGSKAEAIPRGGASDVGALGFVRAGLEFIEQCQASAIEPGIVVLPTGSGGSAAGFIAAMGLVDAPWRVLAPSVSRAPGGFADRIVQKAVRCASLLGVRLEASTLSPLLTVVDARGSGFGSTDPDDAALIQQVYAATGLLIDPAYNAKALRCLQSLQHETSNYVYWSTGGTLGVVDHLLSTRTE